MLVCHVGGCGGPLPLYKTCTMSLKLGLPCFSGSKITCTPETEAVQTLEWKSLVYGFQKLEFQLSFNDVSIVWRFILAL